LVICLFVCLYFLTRLSSLGALPVFLDESVHIQWAERLYGEGRVLKPVSSGRLLAVAAYGAALPFDDRVRASRAIAACAGALTLCFTMLLSQRLFGGHAAPIAGGLYLLSPFALTYDRLALSDGFLAACLTGALWSFHALLQGGPSKLLRVTTAALIALAVVSKVSALLFLSFLPLAVWSMVPTPRGKVWRDLAVVLAAGLALASPMLWVFITNGREVEAQHLVDPTTSSVLSTTLNDMGQWLTAYFTPPFLLMAVFSVALLRNGRALFLALTAALPFAFFAAFSQPWSARYVLPTLAPVIILVAGGISTLTLRLQGSRAAAAAAAITLLTCARALPFSIALLVDPAGAPFPADDRQQLVSGWPSGYGIEAAADRLAEEASKEDVTVFVDTQGTRTLPTSLAVLVGRRPSIHLVEADVALPQTRIAMIEGRAKGRVLVLLGPRVPDIDFRAGMQGDAERLAIFDRPGGEWAVTLFEIRPNRR
jgi:4-amino-4-deoxy-L-arabinose transferase-like glycosyltransferase